MASRFAAEVILWTLYGGLLAGNFTPPRPCRRNMITRWTLLAALLLGTSSAKATHIIGGELYYDRIDVGFYQVTLKLYRDCSALTGFDDPIVIGVFDPVTGALITSQYLAFPGATEVPIVLESPCLTLPPDVCIETTSYSGFFTLPASPNGYQLTYQRCCRTGIIDNLVLPEDLGITVTTIIPGEAVPINSSPRFVELPPVALCLNAPLSFDHSAFDPDGDSLVYSLATPLNGANLGNVEPDPPAPPPYDPVPWEAGYSDLYQIDSDPAITIDPVTGLLTLTPTLQGNFNVGVSVKEYRNGVLLTETLRDFLFKVVACDASVQAGIAPQPASLLCTGLTMPYSNTSFGATQWAWDFGDPNTTADTSSAQDPTWTYAQQGTYVVTQIANPGTSCADTTQTTYLVYIAPSPFVLPPPPFCGNDPVTLVAEGMFGPDATLQWVLGGNSVPPTSTDSIVTVQFDGPGTHEVTLLVAENGCTAFYTDYVINYGLPTADFLVDPPSPQNLGVVVDITDASNGNGGTITNWSWTLDGVSMGSSTNSVVWNTNFPGTYLIGLQVTTADGCVGTTSQYFTVIGGEIVIPNVFSPNGDQANETFHISNVQYYPNELTIYGRWGNKVYQKTNYKNTWDGGGVPEGTYYYVLQMDDGREFSGHLTIVR
jgi:gliding motility-associated-like protein